MSVLIALFICHYLADFTFLAKPFQAAKATPWGKSGWNMFFIGLHAFTHSTLMLVVLCFVVVFFPGSGSKTDISTVCAIQFLTHWMIDTGKGLLNYWEPFRNPFHWVYWHVFGADQLAHALVILWMAYTLGAI